MISVVCNWLYMGILVFIAGMALMQPYSYFIKKLNRDGKTYLYSPVHIFVAGIVATTLYAQIFSLFYRVNIEANMVLIVISCIYVIWQRKYIKNVLAEWKQRYSVDGKMKYVFWGVGILALIAYGFSTAGEAILFDTDWYHGQTIRWIEEYGCVKGVANLHYSLGFNNAQHYFDALFSMVWAFGQSLKCTGGFFGILFFFHGWIRLNQWKKHEHHIADILAVWEIVYSIIITAFFKEPYVDTLPNMLVLFIFIEWIALVEEKREDIAEYGWYCLLGVFATIFKTSAAPIVLLTAYAIYLIIKQRKYAYIGIYILIGFVMAIPYLISNILVTGYPIYLFTSLDLFDVPWKIDAGIIDYALDNMVASARVSYWPMEYALNCGLEWVKIWFKLESASHKILYFAIVAVIVYDLVAIIKDFIKKQPQDMRLLWCRVCAYIGLIYWFFTIPQVKYSWAFLIFPLAVVPAYYIDRNKGIRSCTLLQKGISLLAAGILIMYTGFYGIRTLGYVKEGLTKYPVMQADYVHRNMETTTLNNHTFYIWADGMDNLCGYYAFPYLDNKDNKDKLVVGDDLGDGYYLE